MSYSFSAKGANKAEASAKVAEELAKVVLAQPVHAADQVQAQAATDAFINLLADDEAQDVVVSVNGSLWSTDAGILQSSVTVNAALANRT
jgi:hypothetical protein